MRKRLVENGQEAEQVLHGGGYLSYWETEQGLYFSEKDCSEGEGKLWWAATRAHAWIAPIRETEDPCFVRTWCEGNSRAWRVWGRLGRVPSRTMCVHGARAWTRAQPHHLGAPQGETAHMPIGTGANPVLVCPEPECSLALRTSDIPYMTQSERSHRHDVELKKLGTNTQTPRFHLYKVLFIHLNG